MTMSIGVQQYSKPIYHKKSQETRNRELPLLDKEYLPKTLYLTSYLMVRNSMLSYSDPEQHKDPLITAIQLYSGSLS